MYLGADGEFWVPAHLSFSSLYLEDAPGALSLVVTDLTQQKRQEALVADGRLSQEILMQAEQAIAVCDQSGRIIRASRGLHQLCHQNPLLLPFQEAFPLRLTANQPFLPYPLVQGEDAAKCRSVLSTAGWQAGARVGQCRTFAG